LSPFIDVRSVSVPTETYVLERPNPARLYAIGLYLLGNGQLKAVVA